MANELAELRKIVYKSVENRHELDKNSFNSNDKIYFNFLEFGKLTTCNVNVVVHYIDAGKTRITTLNIKNGDLVSATNSASDNLCEFSFRCKAADDGKKSLYLLLEIPAGDEEKIEIITNTEIISDPSLEIRFRDLVEEYIDPSSSELFLIDNGNSRFINRDVFFRSSEKYYQGAQQFISVGEAKNTAKIDYLEVTKGLKTPTSSFYADLTEALFEGNRIELNSHVIAGGGPVSGFKLGSVVFMETADEPGRFNGDDNISYLDKNRGIIHINLDGEEYREYYVEFSEDGESFSITDGDKTLQENIKISNSLTAGTVVKNIVADTYFKSLDSESLDYDSGGKYIGEKPTITLQFKETESGISSAIPSDIHNKIDNDSIRIRNSSEDIISIDGLSESIKIGTTEQTALDTHGLYINESEENIVTLNKTGLDIQNNIKLNSDGLVINDKNIILTDSQITSSRSLIASPTGTIIVGQTIQIGDTRYKTILDSKNKSLTISDWKQQVVEQTIEEDGVSYDVCDLVFTCSHS